MSSRSRSTGCSARRATSCCRRSGPIYFDPGAFASLPASEVTNLQAILLDQRVAFLNDPAASTPQSIAAFASLHISMSFTAALTAQLLGVGRRLRIALWVWLAVTAVGTVYLGWHYVVDDIAGVLMGAAALGLARVATGVDLGRRGCGARESGPRAAVRPRVARRAGAPVAAGEPSDA